jgi:hypothetical protein
MGLKTVNGFLKPFSAGPAVPEGGKMGCWFTPSFSWRSFVETTFMVVQGLKGFCWS